MACGLLAAPGDVMMMAPSCVPGVKPVGLTETVRVVAVCERVIQGKMLVATKGMVAPVASVIVTVSAAGLKASPITLSKSVRHFY
jgi:hypothetical protein